MLNKTSNERGFSLTELIVVVGLIGVLSLVAVPSLLTYWQSSSLTAGAEQLASVMNRARQLAVRSNTSVCVERTGTTVRLRTVSGKARCDCEEGNDVLVAVSSVSGSVKVVADS